MQPVAYIAAGAGSLYCGACAHDQALVRQLRARGLDVLLVPLYTPLRWDGQRLEHDPVFLGGVSTWMRQSSKLLRPVAALLRPVLDGHLFLRAISRLAVQTDAQKLGPMTLSVLQGAGGPHAGEIQRLCRHLAEGFRPGIVHLSNTLLSGLAGPLRKAMQCTVLANVQGEEHFLAALPQPYRQQAIDLLRQNLHFVQRLIRPSRAGLDEIARLLARPVEDFAIVPPAVELDVEVEMATEQGMGAGAMERPAGPIVIGYLSAIRPEKGLDLLLEAVRLAGRTTDLSIHLRLAGQIGDVAWWRTLRARLQDMPDNVRCDYLGELDREAKLAFLRSCHIFCMPTRLAECRAMAALEAMACGCAVVGPASGIFSELLADGAGLLFESGSALSLTSALNTLLRDPPMVRRLAENATRTAREYSAAHSADALAAIYQELESQAEGTTGTGATRARG